MVQEGAMATAFDLDQFIADCRAARDRDPSHKLVREVVARAVSDPSVVLKGLFEATEQHGLEGVVSKRRDAPYRSGECGEKVKTAAWREAN
jgi:hypothetical protein